MRCNEFKHAWDSLREAAELGHADYNWHDFRRSSNRYASEAGVPASYRSQFLGHRIEVNEGNYETIMGFEFMVGLNGSHLLLDPALFFFRLFRAELNVPGCPPGTRKKKPAANITTGMERKP